MEKYRRWTDQTAGVNPFVAANTQSKSIVKKIITLATLFIKGSIFFAYFPVFIVLYLIPINLIRQNAVNLLLIMFGVYSSEDYSLQKVDKGKINIILSNHTCFLDPIYFLCRYPGCHFLSFKEDQNGVYSYQIVSSLKVILSLFTSLQFFYSRGTSGPRLKQIVNNSSYLKNGGKLIIFYEKIRTNGRGTIRMDKSLADDIYGLQKDVLISQINYTVKKDSLFRLTTSGLSVICSALSTITPGNNIKLRAIKLGMPSYIEDYKDTHSVNEFRQAVNSMAAGVLLETKPKSYFQFFQFYRKTQKQEYKLEQ